MQSLLPEGQCTVIGPCGSCPFPWPGRRAPSKAHGSKTEHLQHLPQNVLLQLVFALEHAQCLRPFMHCDPDPAPCVHSFPTLRSWGLPCAWTAHTLEQAAGGHRPAMCQRQPLTSSQISEFQEKHRKRLLTFYREKVNSVAFYLKC